MPFVLILVLVEDTLRGEEPSFNIDPSVSVLILVLVEDTLRVSVDIKGSSTQALS